MHNIPLDQIVWNPFRDMQIYPIDDDHVKELRQSIREHGFFGGLKGRRKNGVIELGCGHHRIVAARKEKLETIAIFIDDIDDDHMIELMADENATQGGYSGAAVLADVAAVVRRLVAIVLDQSGDFAPIGAKCFEGKKGLDTARGKLLARLDDPDKEGGIGWSVIMRYLGHGDENQSSRSKRQIIEAITTLKQSRRYDQIVDDEIRRHPLPIAEPDKKTNKPKEVKLRAVSAVKPPKKPRVKIYDDRCSALFPHENQAKAFREAVTTEGAKRFISVTKQYELAKQIMDPQKHIEFGHKQTGAPYIKRMVQAAVEEASRKQREIDKEEKERYLAEQREEQIDSLLHNANGNLRGLLSSLARLNDLAREFPSHPKIGGFAERLIRLRDAIDQFSRHLKGQL